MRSVHVVSLSICVFASVAIACGGASRPGNELEAKQAVSAPPAGYYQTDLVDRGGGDITLINIFSTGGFWWFRCDTTPCTHASLSSGTYTMVDASTIEFSYTDSAGQMQVVDYDFDTNGATVMFRRQIPGAAWAAMDIVNETLCDSSGGTWTDDEITADGVNCICGPGQAWSQSGCA